ncbi:MAG: glycosyltransferase family 2 protein [Bacteroidales bacterium]|nr:glycosyltransferase family 2 protein [Bacteroidales bacterium]
MLNIVFWLALFFVFYPYLLYPFLLWFQSKFKQQAISKVATHQNLPAVSIVMAVKNGEDVLRRRLENFLHLDYPKDKLEIIAISDGSTDHTNAILAEFVGNYSGIIKSVAYSPSHGKPYALNEGVSIATGEIILFADSRQVFEPEVVRELVANFHDDNVGCVSGELCFQEDMGSNIKVEMGAYWKFEKWLRKLESSTGSVVGATGAIYAIRKELYKPLPEQTLLDDVLTPMNIVMQGYRVIFEPNAIAYDVVSKDLSQERKRKLRTLSGNWQLLNLAPNLFNPWKNPIWFRFISHKICRLIVPFLLSILLVCSLLSNSLFYQIILWMQVGFYFIALMGLVPIFRDIKIINFSYFFLTMNLITAGGFFVWCTGKCKNAWKVS